MKKCISASSALLATAMMVTLSFGCGETADSDSGSSGLTAEQSKGNSKGTCNSIVARSLGTAQQCNKFGCEQDGLECAELSDTFVEFFFSPADCGAALGMGELNGLPGNASTQPGRGPNAGGPKHIAEVICGAIEECGFCSDAQNLGGICITTEACSTVYTQDFESLDQTNPNALGDDGWLIFGIVFDAGGDFKFGYGPFTAPNGTPGFSSIVAGEGGPEQGAQQLVVYNDYNCCGPSQGHFTEPTGSSRAFSNNLLGRSISADDVGKTLHVQLRRQARRHRWEQHGTGVHPDAGPPGFVQTNFVQIDMTNLPDDLGQLLDLLGTDRRGPGGPATGVWLLEYGVGLRAVKCALRQHPGGARGSLSPSGHRLAGGSSSRQPGAPVHIFGRTSRLFGVLFTETNTATAVAVVGVRPANESRFGGGSLGS